MTGQDAPEQAQPGQQGIVHMRTGFRSKACSPGRLRDGRRLTGDWRLVTCEPCTGTGPYRKAVADEQERARLPLIGRDLALIRDLARQLHRDGTRAPPDRFAERARDQRSGLRRPGLDYRTRRPPLRPDHPGASHPGPG